MNGCEKYREMISAMLDGELDAADSERLIEHMSSCAGCRETYELFSAVSGQSVWELPDAPEGLHEHIMSGVRSHAVQRRRQANIRRLRPWAATAACLVLIAGVIFGVPRFFRAGNAAPAAFNTSVAANNSAPADAAPAEAPAADAPAGYEYKAHSGGESTGSQQARDDAENGYAGSYGSSDNDGTPAVAAEAAPVPEPEAAPESAEVPVLDIDLEKSELTVEYDGRTVTEKLSRDDTLLWLRAVIEGGTGRGIDAARLEVFRLEGADYAVYIYHDGSKLMGSLSEELTGGVELQKLSDFAAFEEMADNVK